MGALGLFLAQFSLLCVLSLSISACGMSTHIDIGHQAINWFKDARNGTDYRQIILNHQDAFIAGNPYPDSMYSSYCYSGKFHSISEDTHWAPFLNATVNYILYTLNYAGTLYVFYGEKKRDLTINQA